MRAGRSRIKARSINLGWRSSSGVLTHHPRSLHLPPKLKDFCHDLAITADKTHIAYLHQLQPWHACLLTFFFCASSSMELPTLRISTLFMANICSSPEPGLLRLVASPEGFGRLFGAPQSERISRQAFGRLLPAWFGSVHRGAYAPPFRRMPATPPCPFEGKIRAAELSLVSCRLKV